MRSRLPRRSAAREDFSSPGHPTQCCPRSTPSRTCPTCPLRRRNSGELKKSWPASSPSGAEGSRPPPATAPLPDRIVQRFPPLRSTKAERRPIRWCRNHRALRSHRDGIRHPSDTARAHQRSPPHSLAPPHAGKSCTPSPPRPCHTECDKRVREACWTPSVATRPPAIRRRRAWE